MAGNEEGWDLHTHDRHKCLPGRHVIYLYL